MIVGSGTQQNKHKQCVSLFYFSILLFVFFSSSRTFEHSMRVYTTHAANEVVS